MNENCKNIWVDPLTLDVASCEASNKFIRAEGFYSAVENGLSRPWHGNVWLNHPFGRHTNALWINKVIEEFVSGRVVQACCITYAATSEKRFQPLLRFPQCFLYPRTNYLAPDGRVKRGVSKGSVVTYLGPNVEAFFKNFKTLGTIKVPFQR